MNPLRSAAAIVAGLGFMLAGSMIGASVMGAVLGASGAYVAASFVTSASVAILGGWLTARIAGRSPMGHAIALAAVFGVLTVIAVTSVHVPGQPAWYGPTVGAIGVAGILVGGWLRSAAAAASVTTGSGRSTSG